MLSICLSTYLLLDISGCSQVNHLQAITPLKDQKPLTILISIDGFRADYLDRNFTPTLQNLARSGAKSSGLTPVFPSVTFPNHYSIVTGLYPDHHGIVNNAMTDPKIPETFRLSSKESVANPSWWKNGIPIWVTATEQGKKSSILFWPGSEAKIHDIQAQDWLVYDSSMSSSQRVSKLLEWLNRPASSRADFATLYFSEVDSSGHRFGPNSTEVNTSLTNVDNSLDQLIRGLKDLHLYDQTTLIIVSDHGMAEVDSSHRIIIGDVLNLFPNSRMEWQGPLAGIHLAKNSSQQVLTELRKIPHMQCWEKNDIPSKFHFGNNPRIPPILCLADMGWTITERSSLITIPGQHGYDPSTKEMQGIFIASGYRIKKMTLGQFENIDVYPLLTHLLHIKAEKNDASDHLYSEIVE